jgi:hypothetical protein
MYCLEFSPRGPLEKSRNLDRSSGVFAENDTTASYDITQVDRARLWNKALLGSSMALNPFPGVKIPRG